jgi:hypothetical protein
MAYMADLMTQGSAIAGMGGGEGDPPPGADSGAKEGLDEILKKLRDVRDASISLKKGWAGMQEVLQSVFQGGTTPMTMFDGLSNQMRNLAGFNISESWIQMNLKKEKMNFLYIKTETL